MDNSATPDSRRASIYRTLSLLFDKPPDQSLLHELISSGFFDLVSDDDDSPVCPLHNLDLEDISCEYTRLFLGPGKHVPPFASVHQSGSQGSGDLWGSTTGEVQRFMKHYGLSLSKPGTIPDHISVLFEFMEKVILAKIDKNQDVSSTLSRQKASKVADDLQKQFFSTYITSWVDEFLAEVDRSQPHVFYGAVIAYSADFIRQERLLLLA
ncbi:MAG: molecular chaperone TorD family protein [candidate division Zixibacteria bacterium]